MDRFRVCEKLADISQARCTCQGQPEKAALGPHLRKADGAALKDLLGIPDVLLTASERVFNLPLATHRYLPLGYTLLLVDSSLITPL